ncbi:MAG: hypothetical protein EPO58_16650 [Chitinophagaceae bacterium]|nr:MAG: hypothetical protein EPO58_16650 [Chitinophagaceae bacterium]
MKHLLFCSLFGLIVTSVESQELFGKKIINISVADMFGTARSGYGDDFGTITPQTKQQDFQLRLNVNTGKFLANKTSMFYGVELPFRINHINNIGTEFLIGLYPYISFVKLVPVSKNIYVSSEAGFRLGYEYYQVRMKGLGEINTNTWQIATFIKPITAIWYIKENLGITLSPWTGQLTYQYRSTISPSTPGRKAVNTLVSLSGSLVASVGIQLKLK